MSTENHEEVAVAPKAPKKARVVASVETNEALAPGHVLVRITKFGNYKIQNGVLGEDLLPGFYSKDEHISMNHDLAQVYEARGFVEIQD